MSSKPDFSKMTKLELRAYVLENRTDQEALQAFLDRAQAENPNPQTYGLEDNISDAIDEYLKKHEGREAS